MAAVSVTNAPPQKNGIGHAERLAAHCRACLDLTDLRLAPEYTYRHLPLAVVDAVYSIGVNYGSVRKTVERFARWARVERFADGAWPPPLRDQLTISEFLDLLADYSAEEMAADIFGNRQRTSPTGRFLLKAEAVRRFASVLRHFKVEYFQDVTRERLGAEAERKIREIPGQKSGISWNYFWMLAGEIDQVKPDRMIMRFIKEATGRLTSPSEARSLMLSACEILRSEHPGLDARRLDYLAWQHERGRPDNSSSQ